jgi:hypothetical protein
MVHQNSLNQEESKDSAKNTTNPRTPKTPKLSPFSDEFGRGIKGKRTTEGSCIYPPTNPKEKGLEIAPRKTPRKALKITKEENREELKQAFRNHTESSIHTMKVHTRSSFRRIILPSHKISP